MGAPTPQSRGTGGQRVGVVGLGTIGGGIAVSLARRGRVPAVHDVRPDAALGLSGVPTALGSAGDVAARSNIVFISVVDAEQVRAALEGADGILRAAHRGLVVLVTATIPVRAIRDLAAPCASQGVTLLDCGVNLGSRGGGQRVAAVRRRARRRTPPSPAGARRHRATGDALRPAGGRDGDKAGVPGRHGRPLASGARSSGACVGRGRRPEDVGRGGRGLRSRWQLPVAATAAQDVGQHGGRVLPAGAALRARNLDKDLEAVQELAAETGVAVPLVDLARANAADTFGWVEQTGESPQS